MTIEQAKSEIIQIYGALSPNKQRAIDTVLHTIEQEPSNVREDDKDHIWYKGGQYISLRRFLKVKAEAEQEPCEDCISRRAVINAIYANSVWENEYNLTSSRIKKAVEELPSVNPQPKTGHWIENAPEYQNIDPPYVCSECGHSNLIKTNYCEQCGAKMVEPQESEEV